MISNNTLTDLEEHGGGGRPADAKLPTHPDPQARRPTRLRGTKGVPRKGVRASVNMRV